MFQNLQNFAKFQKFRQDNLVDFEKCCKTRICLQRSVPIQPKTSEILPKICQIWQLPYGSTTLRAVLKPAAAVVNRSDNEALCVLDACWAQFRAAAATDTVGVRVRVSKIGKLCKIFANF